jgi:hypothetical protein
MAELTGRVFCVYDMQGTGLGQASRISEEITSQTIPSNKPIALAIPPLELIHNHKDIIVT